MDCLVLSLDFGERTTLVKIIVPSDVSTAIGEIFAGSERQISRSCRLLPGKNVNAIGFGTPGPRIVVPETGKIYARSEGVRIA